MLKGCPMPWTESLSVQVAQFDEEHKKLIAMIDELREAMREGRGKEIIEKILRETADYTVFHFRNEEQAMKRFSYPGLERHKAQHDEFVAKAVDLKESHEQGRVALSVSVLNFLNSWVSDHIQKTDKEYASFFNEHGLK
jgi:hemerythrin-like metal-binding protein